MRQNGHKALPVDRYRKMIDNLAKHNRSISVKKPELIFLCVCVCYTIRLFDHFHSVRNILLTFIVSFKYLEIATL